MTVTEEIALIADNAPDDIFYAYDLIDYAQTYPDSALHACFDWSKGEKYRKNQAAALIEGVGGRRAESTKVP
jgi:hypothetical protein